MKKIVLVIMLFLMIPNIQAASLDNININKMTINNNYLNIKNANRNINNIENVKNVIYKELNSSKNGYKYDGIETINIYPYDSGYLAYVKLFSATKNNKKTSVNFVYHINKNLKITNTEIDDIDIIKKEYLQDKGTDVPNDLSQNIAILKTYTDNQIDKMAFGSFISNDTILTSAKFIKESLYNNQEIIILKDNNTINIKGIITINDDLCLLKLDYINNTYFNIGNLTKGTYNQITNNTNYKMFSKKIKVLNNDDIAFSKSVNNNFSYASVIVDNNNNLVGIAIPDVSYSNYEAILNLKYLKNNLNFNNYKDYEEVKKSYVISTQNSTVLNYDKDNITEYEKIGDLKNNVHMNLVRSNLKDGVATFRFENKIARDSLSGLLKYTNKLLDEGFKLQNSSNLKEIYQNNNYKIEILNMLNSSTIIISKE